MSHANIENLCIEKRFDLLNIRIKAVMKTEFGPTKIAGSRAATPLDPDLGSHPDQDLTLCLGGD